MDDPVPVRRGVVGCLVIVALVAGLMVLVRPAIFTLAPPRDDSAVVVGMATDLRDEPRRTPVVLSRSYGWAGERAQDDGVVQLEVLVGSSGGGGPSAVNGWSPGVNGCEVEVTASDWLEDCNGQSWTYDGTPLEAGIEPLERFPVTIDGGSVVVDLTRTLDQ